MSLRILVVDDDKFMREMLPPVLAHGYAPDDPPQVDVVGTPAEVTRFLEPRAHEVLVVLSDHDLKTTKNGLDVLAEVKRARPDAIRVLFSGHAREEIRGLDDADVHGFIEKPFRLQELVPALRAIVERHVPGRALQGHGGRRSPAEASRRSEAARALPGEEIVPALVRAATKGEGVRARTLFDEAERRGQHAEAEREATRALVWQNRVLELVATGVPLGETLSVLARVVEEQAPGLLASVLLLDDSRKRLVHGAAPSLPDAYNRAIDGIPVGPGEGSCGTAAFERRAIIVTDTLTDPLWARYRHLAQEHGLAACWSTPILSPSGRLLGTFALYYREPREPGERELQLIELGSNLARVVIESHQSREELRASEARYRSLFNSIDQGFCVLEMLYDEQGRVDDYRFIEVNAAFEAQTGMKDPTGKTIRTLEPNLEARWFEIYGKVARTGASVRFEDHSHTFARWFDVFAFRVGEPELHRVGVLFSDITQRKNTEAEKEVLMARERAALAETAAARERLRAVILQAPIGIAILSGPRHVFELVNASYEELSGRASGDLVGRTHREVFPELDESFCVLLDKVFESGEAFVGKGVPVRLRRHGGLQDIFVDFTYCPSRDARGVIDGIIVVAHEVTEQVQARLAAESAAADREELLMRERSALAEADAQRERLHDLFMQAPAAIAIADGPEYVFSFANPLYERLVGKTSAELLGRRVVDVFPEVVEQGFIALLDGVRTSGQPFRAEALPITFRQDGSERTLFLNFVYQPVHSRGEFASIMAHAVDVTQQVNAQKEAAQLAATLEARVRERTRALEDTNRDLESFSSVVSHDLRAPLRAVHHLVSVVLDDVPDLPSDARITLAAAKRSTEEMARLIEGLLALARAAQAELEIKSVDVSALARSILTELALGEPGRRVETIIEPHLQARADPRLLRSVLDNLLGNAWKFTAHRPVARVELGRMPGTQESFFVRDNGIGFDMKEAVHLFQPFKRLHNTAVFDGTGIGLATARRAIERHGGRIWAESKPDDGSTFFFTLPQDAP